MQFENIAFEISNDVATVTLNRPERLNALSRPLLGELRSALDQAVQSGNVRALLICGAGRAFSSGADLAAGSSPVGSEGFDAGEVLEEYYNPLMERMFSLPFPVVSAVQGAVVGAGCMVALAADFVIAARSAYFLQAFVNIGLVPDAGSTWWLPRLIGPGRALAMMMLGERIASEQAATWGMVHEVVDDEALPGTARALAERLAKGPTRTYSMIRRAVREGLSQEFGQALAAERVNQKIAGNSPDFLEGVTAFREKRKPNFTGQ